MGFPNYPGIPALQGDQAVAAAALLASTALGNLLDLRAKDWGVFNADGSSIEFFNPDSFLELEYVNNSSIPTFPQEQGAFASYNKVQNPRSHSVTMSKGGSKADMSSFVTALETLEASLDLYTIVTPNKSYVNVNVDRVEYRRTAMSGAGIIIATMHFTEIRQASAVFSQPGAISATATVPEAQSQVSNGQTQTTAAPTVTGSSQ